MGTEGIRQALPSPFTTLPWEQASFFYLSGKQSTPQLLLVKNKLLMALLCGRNQGVDTENTVLD